MTAENTVKAGGAVTRDNSVKGALLVVLIAAAIAFPKVLTNPATTNYGVLAMIFVTVASAWNIFSGYSGYISIGHAVFFGSGAYAMGVAAEGWKITGTATFALLPFVGLIGALIAVPFGLIALRVRRHTFIVITIAIFFIFQLMAYNLSFTHGTQGMNAPFLNWPEQGSGYNTPFYYVALGYAAGAIAISWLVRRSRFGLQLRAIRDDEDRARGLGVKVMRVKLAAFVISGCITSMIGAVWFFYLTQVQPNTGFDPLFDLLVVLMAFFGGYGSISGPVLGALIIEPGTLWLNTQVNSYVSEIMLGAIFLVIVLFVPRGIIPTTSERITRIRTKGRPAVVPAVHARGDTPPGGDSPGPGGQDPPDAERASRAAKASRGGNQ